MKKFILFLLFVSLMMSLHAQSVPSGIQYQAVARTVDGEIVPDKEIALQISFVSHPEEGKLLYSEIQHVRTNQFGLFSLIIGQGEPVAGAFNKINWSNNEVWMELAMDFEGGNQFEWLNSTKLFSVPYALHARSAESIVGGSDNKSWNGSWNVGGNNLDRDLEFGSLNEKDINIISSGILRVLIEDTGDISFYSTATFADYVFMLADLGVEGKVKITNNLQVFGDTYLNRLTVSDNVRIEGNLVLGGTAQFLGEVNIDEGLNIGEDLTVSGNTHLMETLTVDGVTNLNDDTSINGNTQIGENLVVDGTTELNMDLTVQNCAPARLTGPLTVDKQSQLNETLTVEGKSTFNDAVDVNNGAPVNLSGSLTTEGPTNLNNNLTVHGQSQLNQDLTVQGVSNFNQDLHVNNAANTNLSGNLSVGGTTNLNDDLSVKASVEIDNDLSVLGNTNLNGDLVVEEVSTFNNDINVTNDANLNVSGNLNVTGETVLGTGLNATSLEVSGQTTLNQLDVSNISNFANDVNVTGDVQAANVDINVNATIGGKMTSASADISGHLTAGSGRITGNLNVDNDFVVAGNTTVQKLEAQEAMTIHNTVTGTENDLNAYGLKINSMDQGMAITLNNATNPNKTNNFITFYNNLGLAEGRIEGMTEIEILETFDYIWTNINYGFQIALITAEGIACTAQADLAEVAVMVAQAIVIAADLVAYNADYATKHGVAFESNGADYAEWLQKDNPTETFSFGDVVGMKAGKISKFFKNPDRYMVVSHNPIVIGNMPEKGKEKNYEKIAFIGQVPVKVVGDVHEGDYIIASKMNDGFAYAKQPSKMQLSEYDNIVGQAWGITQDNGGFKYVNTAVGLNQNDLIHELKKQTEEMDRIKAVVNKLSRAMAEINPAYENDELVTPKNPLSEATPGAALDIDLDKVLPKYDDEVLAKLQAFVKERLDKQGIKYHLYDQTNRLVTDLEYMKQHYNSLLAR